METMAEHSFMASWNYVQYREARRNISVSHVISYMILPKIICVSGKMKHKVFIGYTKQVTLMPTVAHYCCVKCEQLVTHEIVGQYLVKLFTSRSIKVLKVNNVYVCKIKSTDQAPSQYKNKTAFNYLANSKIPTQRNYVGTRHGKSSCDACSGRVSSQ